MSGDVTDAKRSMLVTEVPRTLAAGTTLILRDGSFVDSTVVPPDAPFSNDRPLYTPNAVERPGIYHVTVRRAGYATWERQDVAVSQGRCGLRSVTLTARLLAAD